MVGPRRAAAAALAACALVAQGPWLACAQTTASQAGETMAFFATSDWGGQAAAPYTTPLQLAMAEAMGHVSASFHPHFVVSAGGNFLPGGLPGACTCSCQVAWQRSRQHTWAARSCPRAGQCRGTSPADELSTSF
jgi:hypothetical protein